MQRLTGIAALLLLVSSCASLGGRAPHEGRSPVVRAEAAREQRPHGYDRWYRPQWGPPYTVSDGYAWVYAPCR